VTLCGIAFEHAQPAAQPSLITMDASGLDDEPLLQGSDRTVVAIGDALVDSVASSLHPAPVQVERIRRPVARRLGRVGPQRHWRSPTNSPTTAGTALDHGGASIGSATTRIALRGAAP